MNGTSLSAAYGARFTAALGGRDESADVLPAGSAQRRFVIGAEVSGRRLLVPYGYVLQPGALDERELRERLVGLLDRHPALRCRVDYDDRGLIVQRRTDDPVPPYEVLRTPDEAAVAAAVRRMIVRSEVARQPCPVRAALLVGTGCDRLVLVFDHSVIDEWSLREVTRTLFGDPGPAPADAWAQYRDAVWHWLDHEAGAGIPGNIDYWVRRLAGDVAHIADGEPGAPPGSGGTIFDQPPIALRTPRARATLFPRLLAATHDALGKVDGSPSTVIYPWGARPSGVGPVVGCFMNTVFSVLRDAQMSRSWQWEEFRRDWWRDLEHAHVPFDDVVLAVNQHTRSGWSGTARCLLGFEDLTVQPVPPPGGPLVGEWLPTWLAPKCAVNTTARFDGSALSLRVVVGPGTFADGGTEFAVVWRDRVAEYLSL